MKTKPKTIKVFIPRSQLPEAVAIIRSNKARHWPFVAHWNGYEIELEDHPVATYLELKYGNFSVH